MKGVIMEKKKAIVYFTYRLSYDNNLPSGIPIYKFGSESGRPIGYTKEHVFEDRKVIPREFETEKEAELAKAEFEKIGLGSNWKVERILTHIEILDE